MRMSSRTPWWFPRKRIGFGWGLPCVWQGWVILGAFVLLMAVGLPIVGWEWGSQAMVPAAIGLTVGLIGVCLLKGEPLWGRRAAADADAGGTGDSRPDAAPRAPILKYKVFTYGISVLAIGLSLPLALREVPKNGLYGLRDASTLAGSTAHWYYVNQVAGIAMIVAALLSVVLSHVIADRIKGDADVTGRLMLTVTIALIVASSLVPLLVQ